MQGRFLSGILRPETESDMFGLTAGLINRIGNEQFFIATVDKMALFSAEITKMSFQYNTKDDVLGSFMGLGHIIGHPGGSDGKESACNTDTWVQSLVGKISWRRKWLQYSCLENSMERGAWQATVHGVTQSWTRLID